MVQLRWDIYKKSGIKPSIKQKGKSYNIQGAYSTRSEAVKDAKFIRKGGSWRARVIPYKFKGSGKYKGKTVYALYGRVEPRRKK